MMSIIKTFLRRNFHQVVKRAASSYYTVQSDKIEKHHNDIEKQIRFKIQATGPITVAEYMNEVLTHPVGGYYMHRNVFGQGGDFITSPELGQVFGEMIAVWFVNEWSKAGSPKPVQIVELGPGTGNLCQDLLRVFSHFRILEDVSIHLVEISPHLTNIQSKKLCLQSEICVRTDENADQLAFQQGKTAQGVSISWYKDLNDVPKAFTLLIAHEFFDALPIHKFQKTDEGYREILIDIDPTKDCGLRFVLANAETPTGAVFIKENESRPHIEVSPKSLALAQKIAARLEADGGLALIADYGNEGTGTDTFRAFKKHKQQNPLLHPGTADLTADVDFDALKRAAVAKHDILAFGPISQRQFLLNMGIEYRLNKLKEKANEKEIESLNFGYDMMVGPDKMGNRFKFFALVPASLGKILHKFPLTGF